MRIYFPEMPRRASSSVHPLWILGVVVLLLAAVVGGYSLYNLVSDPYRTLTPFDVPAYMENANSLRGNVYKLNGTIASKLAWSVTNGSLYSVEINGDVVPLLVPSQFNHINIQKGQRFFIRVEVGDKGILRAQDIRKA